MHTSFEQYSDILLTAYQTSVCADDFATKKTEILNEIFYHYNITADDVLFVGFSPGMLKITNRNIFVTQVSKEVCDFLSEKNVVYTYVDFDTIKEKSFPTVIAFDEYFTFANEDLEQREMVDRLMAIAQGHVITTLKDYKNQDYREKEFSYPVMIQNQDENKIFFEHYLHDQADRNLNQGTIYIVDNEGVTLVGPFNRRAMFFKQLAKFSLDAGAKNFLVHKNLMYKSTIKKNYEHIITIEI